MSKLDKWMRYYREHAEDALNAEDYASASDSIIADDIPQAKYFSDEALNACRMGNLTDKHLELARVAKALSSGNREEAEKHWEKIGDKLHDEVVNLYRGALRKV
ncbi:MAG: hypothetical protein ACTSSA_05265 [Candidatus Freyarchaeota archaeon]